MNGAQNSQKLLLVDGSNLLFQMFYGMPARILGKNGRPIHGTLGFCGALLKILRLVSPTHALVLFDGEHENARAELDLAYKANRTDLSALPEEETPFSQLPDVHALLTTSASPLMKRCARRQMTSSLPMSAHTETTSRS